MSAKRNYEELSIIGKGAYGTVFKAIDHENDRTVALKRVRILSNSEEKGVPVSTLREITLLKQLDNMAHPNIVRMFDAFQTYSTTPTDSPSDLVLTIVFEHVDQDLSQFLHSCPPPGLPEALIKDLMHQLLSGIDYLHINRMVHRDIKPQNVLITKNKQVKIADFGLARVYGFCKLVTSVVVTLWYRAPEVLLQSTYGTMIDIWSIGAIMAEMYNRRPLFPGKSEMDQLNKILDVLGLPEKSEWPEDARLPWQSFQKYGGIDIRHLVTDISSEGLDLIKKLLVFDPSNRYSAKRCLEHPYFSEVNPKFNHSFNVTKESSNQSPLKDWYDEKKQSHSRANQNKHEHYAELTRNTALCTDVEEHLESEKMLTQDVNLDKKSDRLDDLFRSDSGLSDCFSALPQASLSRADSGICVSPPNVFSDAESSSSSSSSEQKDIFVNSASSSTPHLKKPPTDSSSVKPNNL